MVCSYLSTRFSRILEHIGHVRAQSRREGERPRLHREAQTSAHLSYHLLELHCSPQMASLAAMTMRLFASPHSARVAVPASALVADSVSLYMQHSRSARAIGLFRALRDEVFSGNCSFADA